MGEGNKVEDGKRVKESKIGCGCFSNFGGQMNFPLLIVFFSTIRFTAPYSLLALYFTWRQSKICVDFSILFP